MGSHDTVAVENMKDISTVLSSIDEESWFDKNPYNDESEEVDVNGKKGSSEKSDSDGEYVGLVKVVAGRWSEWGKCLNNAARCQGVWWWNN